jgi:hypothetical protein
LPEQCCGSGLDAKTIASGAFLTAGWMHVVLPRSVKLGHSVHNCNKMCIYVAAVWCVAVGYGAVCNGAVPLGLYECCMVRL